MSYDTLIFDILDGNTVLMTCIGSFSVIGDTAVKPWVITYTGLWRKEDEFSDNPFDIDKQNIYCAIPSGWPGSFSDILCSSCIACFSRYTSWLVDTLLRSNTSDS